MQINRILAKFLQGEKVEWKTLGEVVTIEKGVQLNKSLLSETGKYPVINGGVNPSGYWHEYNYTADKIVISQGGASAGFVNWLKTPFFAGTHAFVILPDETTVLNRYVFHFVKMKQRDFMEKQYGAGIPALAKSELVKLPIPVPSLHIQQKIANTLDKFTELNEELNKELALRKKQFTYYRNLLLDYKHPKNPFSGCEVPWKMLAEVSNKISSGGTPRTGIADYYDGDIPWLRTQEVNFNEILDTEIKITTQGLENSSAKMIPANCVILAMYGATVGRVAINKIPLTTNQACANIELNSKILNYRYAFHYLSSQYEYIKSLGTGSQSNINAQIVKKLEIPVPPLEIQTKVVEMLDKFDTLVNSSTDGLPREIQLRQKQYEYYREQLLDFPREN
ncbi:restriction endonuclease subunit S [Kingella negevensis]|uniref:Putative type-1 restriction enzyme specificity protein MPN_089 n=1 Tax=Kingella negevensis TaxID=1522312 RepID=A0A238HDM3_9NEIS|nr:restriction endonuclease subunit S [Kingella negevensis]MDK4683892.1 restriction endonuclease subunit S [Kingella negevensis]MDK4706997.1 restriction endonuclease subunit S [Kingella negevensis]MDK4710577.1 restriction endonuclease subunit S [Kingella negevensis]SNB85226.1 Putative type-1 restriction enzyme specificity protein MPN_089 [Kingella negevensis]